MPNWNTIPRVVTKNNLEPVEAWEQLDWSNFAIRAGGGSFTLTDTYATFKWKPSTGEAQFYFLVQGTAPSNANGINIPLPSGYQSKVTGGANTNNGLLSGTFNLQQGYSYSRNLIRSALQLQGFASTSARRQQMEAIGPTTAGNGAVQFAIADEFTGTCRLSAFGVGFIEEVP